MVDLKTEFSVKQIFMADLLLVFVAFIWGAGIPMSALLARSITPLWAVALRMLMAAFFLVLMFPKKIITSTRHEWAVSALLTAVLTGTFISLTFGLIYSTASKQGFIGGLNVILVPIFVWAIYKTKPSPWIFGGAGITTAGLLVMGFTPGMEFNFGDFLSFIMAIFYAFQVLAAGFCVRRVEPYRLVALHIIMLAAVMTILALIFEPLPDIRTFSMKIWATLLCVSLGNTILCFILQFKAQRITPEAHVAVIFSLEGLFGYMAAVLSGQDPFHIQGAVGGMLVIAGMILTETETFLKHKLRAG
ncbi:MAG: DMT family transporter [Synergistaceae bacterium]|nr:DMT family transporter [Synergistaceae bacterium]